MNSFLAFAVLVTLALHACAEDAKEVTTSTSSSAIDRATSILKASVLNDNDASKWSVVPSGYGSALATGGAVVIGVVVLLAIAAVVSPLFGYRLCQIFSTCDAATGQSFSGDGYSGYASAPSYSTYQKRSIEYVGPILQALNSAYEKYGHGGPSPLSQVIKKTTAQQQ
ncbi:uncharacterized protein LOC126842625 [Adelges cooleyi]|uniref:uncharacterized protein LOC126842625 n=1 Tax=Adelges cooleyi TaxID=133065 RepID=UPI0021808C76|nr:uncharacterized protein LOC126842625 [Adelges cooleyi]